VSTVVRANGHQRLPRRCLRAHATKMSLDLKDFNFSKLGAANASDDLWFVKMKYLLKGKKLFSAIEGLAGATSSGEGQAAEAAATDAQAKAVIALCVADHLLVTVDKAASARAAWADLQAIFQSKSVAQMQRTRRDFNSLKLQPGESITDYISRAETLRSSMELAGQQVDDNAFTMTLLDGLPKDYFPVVTIIESSVNLPSLSEVRGTLLRAEEQLAKDRRGSPASSDGEAVVVNMAGSKIKGCWSCGRPGHIKNNCPKRKMERDMPVSYMAF
jgi:hypothetical protein